MKSQNRSDNEEEDQESSGEEDQECSGEEDQESSGEEDHESSGEDIQESSGEDIQESSGEDSETPGDHGENQGRLTIQQSQSFQGPIPPPELYRAYESVLPGSADRILSMAEQEQSKRIDYDHRMLEAGIEHGRRSDWLSFGLNFILIAAFVLLVIFEYPLYGGGAFVAFIVYAARRVISSFFKSDKKDKNS